MTEKQYIERRAATISRIYRHADPFANGNPKFPRCLAADKRELKRLDEEYELQCK